MITVGSASIEDASAENGPHMTGPSADAAASCGDNTLSQKNKLERRKTKCSEKCRRAKLYTTQSCAAGSDMPERMVHNIPPCSAKQEWV